VVDEEADDRAVRELVGALCGVVGVVDVVASAGGDKDVVVATVDIGDETVAGIDRGADSGVRGVLGRDEGDAAETVGGSPVDVAAASIAAVVGEPGVHLAGIATPATSSTVHRDRGDGTAGTADGGARAGAKTVATPLGVALAPGGSIDPGDVHLGSSKTCNESKKENETHFSKKHG